MSIARTNICCPGLGISLRDTNSRHERARLSSLLCLYAYSTSKSLPYKAFPRLVHTVPKYRRFTVQVMGGERYSEGKHEEQPVEDLYTLQQQRKKQTVEDLLREQIQKQEFYKGDDGGSKKPPKHGGGGGGGSDNSNFSELRDELLQVILATIGFVFLYVCIVRGDELTRLSVDFIRYLFGAQTSPRLKRAFDKWEHLSQSILGKHAKITTEEKHEITTTGETPEGDDDDEHWMDEFARTSLTAPRINKL